MKLLILQQIMNYLSINTRTFLAWCPNRRFLYQWYCLYQFYRCYWFRIKNQLHKDLAKAKFFSVLYDGSTDSWKTKLFIACILIHVRYALILSKSGGHLCHISFLMVFHQMLSTQMASTSDGFQYLWFSSKKNWVAWNFICK